MCSKDKVLKIATECRGTCCGAPRWECHPACWCWPCWSKFAPAGKSKGTETQRVPKGGPQATSVSGGFHISGFRRWQAVGHPLGKLTALSGGWMSTSRQNKKVYTLLFKNGFRNMICYVFPLESSVFASTGGLKLEKSIKTPKAKVQTLFETNESLHVWITVEI